MEEWQRKHINQNLPELIGLTKFNVMVKAEFIAQNILSQADIDKLDALQTQHGESDASYHYYQFLMGRTNAYKVLTKAFVKNRQTGAARILMDGVPKEVSDTPLTYLGIQINWDEFMDMLIEVNGKMLMLRDFLPAVNHARLQQIFQETVSELDIYDTFVTKEGTFVLAENTIPTKPSIYLPRFLSNRIKFDECIFKASCPDVFVFKNSIARYKVSEIAKPHFTDTSTSQLTRITRRFIYLDDNEDWFDLKKKCTEVPIHLINYEAAQNHFLLEDTSHASDFLRKLGSEKDRVYMTEEDFVQQQLSENCTSSSVCICDSPGMGKTFLLANIARNMTERCTGRIIVFVQITQFAKKSFPDRQNGSLKAEASLINVLNYICTSQQNLQLLHKLVKAELIQVEIFFDGFDELPTDKVDWMKQAFKVLITNFQTVRIYITSRPHMRQELEQTLGVVAYDILPFNHQNQVDFLVQFWQNRNLSSDQLSLETHAASCLKAVNNSLTEIDKEIAGIPLLCQLIAEVYSDQAAFRSIKRRRLLDVPGKISGLYQKFIKNKINLVSKHQNRVEELILVHIWHAFKLLFPKENFHKQSHFDKIGNLLKSPVMLTAGILKKQPNETCDFIHRTFAEYLVAEYLTNKIQGKSLSTSEEINQENKSMFRLLLQCRKTKPKYPYYNEYYFLHPVIVKFFDSLLSDDGTSEKLNIKVSNIISSYSNDEFISILCACCEHSLLNIFLLLSGALSKCENSWIHECFTVENSYELLKFCIERSTSQIFHACIQLLTKVLKLDIVQINKFKKNPTLVMLAVSEANFEAVEYFLDKVSLKNQRLLLKCVQSSNSIEKRENILNLLLSKDPTLIHETPHILFADKLDVRLFKILIKFGANLTVVHEMWGNCVMSAATRMSPTDFQELVEFLLKDCKAEYLFLKNEKWKDPLPTIIKEVELLSNTMELLLNIPGMDIRMKDRWEESLLFHVVNPGNMNELQELVKSGVDYMNARDKWNRNLLQAAVDEGVGVKMVRYLLSLKLDPNSGDEDGWTPLHLAVDHGRLSVVKVLVENGADVQAKDKEDQTALHWSVALEYIGVFKYLIEKGAEVNVRDKNGNTPLHLCRESTEVKEFLIEMGANIHVKNNEGQTPAQKYPHLWN